MNLLSRDKQIEIIASLTEGVGIRATARLVGVNRETVGKLALQIGRGCAELHDRRVVGVRVARIELDEVWSFVGKKQKRVKPYVARITRNQLVAGFDFASGRFPTAQCAALIAPYGPLTKGRRRSARPPLSRRPAHDQFAGVMTLVSTGTSLAARPA
jgi:hypothetical protein